MVLALGRIPKARGRVVSSKESGPLGAITTLYPKNALPVSMLNVLRLTFRKIAFPF